MQEFIVAYMPWALSAFTIYTMYLAGSKNRHTWAVGLASQFFWVVWIVASGSWGLLPGNIALWIVYLRNHFKWREVL